MGKSSSARKSVATKRVATRRVAKKHETSESTVESIPAESIGIDLGDRKSDYIVLGSEGEKVEQGRITTSETQLRGLLSRFAPTVVAIEVGTHSPWVSRVVTSSAHRVVVANPRKVALISKNKRKNNRIDAETLGRLARVDTTLLYPIQHRGETAQADLAVLRARDVMVRARTRMISHVRGAVKSIGASLPRTSAEAFAPRCRSLIPEMLAGALTGILDQIEGLNRAIREMDRSIHQMIERYPAAKKLMKVTGVGELTGVAYVLVLEEPRRFARSRSTGAYLGLVPGSDDTGDTHVQKRITKEGDKFLRRLLVSAAQYILGPFGVDCDLRRHGEAIAERGGKNGKKRAVVAVARKLAVLLHKLWISETDYDPLYNRKRRCAA